MVKKIGFLLLTIVMLSSCSRDAFMDDIQGQWKITQINYVFDSSTQTFYPADMVMHFNNYNYATYEDGTLTESGTFNVNLKASQIIFYSTLGTNIYLINEKTEIYQHWRRKKQLEGMYIDFKLEKIE